MNHRFLPLAALLLPQLCLAETAATVLAVEMAVEEVVVSATRRETSTTEISAAVGVVDAGTVRAAKLVTDALAETPGVFLQQTTPGQGAAIIRGLRGSSILHLVDGMRLNNAIFRSAPTQYFALVPVSAVERIEALRGTPTSLYGSDAVGGAVQLVTRMPVFEDDATEFGGEVFAGWDSAELGRKLRASLDAGNRRLATSVSLEYLDAGDRRIGGGERIGPSAYESVAGRAAIAWTPDTDTRWFFDLHFLEQESTPRVDELVPGFGQTEPSSSEFFFEPNRRLFAHAQYDRANGPWDLDWRLSLAWQRIDDDRRTRDFGAAERSLEQNRSDLAGAMLTASKQSERGSWLVGFEAYRDEVSSSRVQQEIQTGDLTAITPRFPDGSTVDQAALFVNVDARLSDRHAVSGGLRLNAVEVDLPATLVSTAASVDVTDLSGDLGWRYDVTDTWQLVANLGYGFRAPNVFDLGTLGNRPGNRFNVPNTGLDSENVVQLDAGARRRGDDWQFEIMVYALDYDDRITSVSTGATTPEGRDVVQSVNAAESRIQGVEFGATLLLSEHFDLDAAVSYTRGEQTIEGSDEPADRIPPLGGRLQLLYDSGGPLTVTSWLRFADRQDRLSSRDVSDVRIDPNGTPGFAIVGARADWRFTSGWAFSLGIDNLLDKRYRNHGSGIDAPGFNVAASVSRQW